MFIKRLVLNNFRCYSHLDIPFDDEKIYLTGENGVGKTNIIEAIYYLTIGRSFRKADNEALIKTGEKEASIYIDYHSESDGLDHSLSCIIGHNYKIFAIDGEEVKKISSIFGKLLAIYYEPSLVFFFKDEPEARRRFLDEALCQLSPRYLYSIGRYKKLLKERNFAMQSNYDADVIETLKNQLIIHSYRIVYDRKHLIDKLSQKANSYYSLLFGKNDRKFELCYKTNCPLNLDEKNYVEQCKSLFEQNKSNENLKKTTAIGPHRDDLCGLLNGNELAQYGSQGENRLASLSLKLAVMDELKETLGNQPLLLLDDVTSDLDDARCKNLLSLTSKKNLQVFITGTTIRSGFENYKIYKTNGTELTTGGQHNE